MALADIQAILDRARGSDHHAGRGWRHGLGLDSSSEGHAMRYEHPIARVLSGTLAVGLDVVAIAGGGYLVDAVRGVPQTIPSARVLDSPIVAGTGMDLAYTSEKMRQCPLEVERRLYALDADGLRTGRRIELPDDFTPASTGHAAIGDDEIVLTIHIPAWVPPGRYEYAAKLTRQCVPFVGRRWSIHQPPAKFRVVARAQGAS